MQNKKKYFIFSIVAIILIAIGFVIFSKNKGATEVPNNQDISAGQADNQNQTEGDTDIPQAPVVVTTASEVDKLFVRAAEQQVSKDFAGAKLTLESAMKIDPNNAYLMQTYASLLAKMGDMTGAITWVNKALAIRPTETHFWFLKIDLLRASTKDNFEAMKPVYLEAIAKTNNSIDLVTAYASFLGQIGRKQDAITYWEKAIEINPAMKATYEKEISLLK